MPNPPAKAAQGGKAPAAPASKPKVNSTSAIGQVVERIRTSDNVLVALSNNPSIDELTAALGLTYVLDKIGKHATAIFSGEVPNIIEFLEPEKTFETNTDSLQDFIIAINKDKADHLRYKIDGDFVKVFITPYKTTITESDMEFSHGDYNVDLVIAFNVASEEELDGALSEYGRIMHDASSINISAHEPGKFGDLEWGDAKASSVSEMVARLANTIKVPDVVLVDKTVATTLLAGIIAATNRFSNERTTAETMAISAKLMAAGADQQLISSNVPVDILTQEPEPEIEPEVAPKSEAEAELVEAAEKKEAEEQSAKQAKAEALAALDASVAESESEDDAEEESEAEPEAESEPEPEPAAPADPTSLTIHHGAVDFVPEEKPKKEESPEEKILAAKKAEKEAAIKAEANRIAAETIRKQEERAAAKKAAEEKARAEAAAKKAAEAEKAAAARRAIEEKVAADVAAAKNSKFAAPKAAPTPTPAPTEPTIPAPDGSIDDLDRALAAAMAARNEQIVPATVILDKTPEGSTVMPSETIVDAAADAAPQLTGGSMNHVITPSKQEAISEPIADSANAAASAIPTKVIDLPEGGIRPPEPPKDYTAEMEAMLTPEEPAAPIVTPPSMPLVSEAPAAPVQPAVEPMPAASMPNAEYVSPLPMPDPDQILPPPPLPFEPMAAPAMPNAMPDLQTATPATMELPNIQPIQPAGESAQAVVRELQAANAALPSMPAVQPVAVEPVMAAAPVAAPVAQAPAAADPGAFRIPGM